MSHHKISDAAAAMQNKHFGFDEVRTVANNSPMLASTSQCGSHAKWKSKNGKVAITPAGIKQYPPGTAGSIVKMFIACSFLFSIFACALGQLLK